MNPLKTYDFAGVILIIGGFEISGYGDDGGIEYEFRSPVLEDTASADGRVTVSRTNDDRLLARITVKETSKAARDLDGLARTQAAQTTIAPLPYSMRCLTTGDEVTEQYAAFVQTAAPTKARAAGDRVYEILLPNGRKTLRLAQNIAI